MMFRVSQSKVKSWRSCRQQYDYHYVEKLEPKVTPRPFMFGHIVHAMLEASANGADPWKIFDSETRINQKLFREEQDAYGEIAKDIAYIMEEYFEFQPPIGTGFIKIEGKYAEHKFEVPLTSEIICVGRIDSIAKDRKLKWLVEHKTHKTFPPAENRWRDMQSVLYVHMAQQAWDVRLDGTCWNYIKNKSPTRPQITQKGLLSERQIDTLPGVIQDVIKANKLPGLYTTMIDQCKARRGEWFLRVYTPMGADILASVVGDFTDTAVEMSKLHGKSKTRNIGRHCDWCQYRPLCAAALQGMDEDFIKEREFKRVEQETEHDSSAD